MSQKSLLEFYSIYCNIRRDIKRKKFKYVENKLHKFMLNNLSEPHLQAFNNLWLSYTNSYFSIIDFQIAICISLIPPQKYITTIDTSFVQKCSQKFSNKNIEKSKNLFEQISKKNIENTLYNPDKNSIFDIYKITNQENIFWDMVRDGVCDESIFIFIDFILDTKDKKMLQFYNITKLLKILIERKQNG